MSRLHRRVHHCLSQQAYGAPEGRPDNQDRVGGNMVEEQSRGGGWELGEDPIFGMSASEFGGGGAHIDLARQLLQKKK